MYKFIRWKYFVILISPCWSCQGILIKHFLFLLVLLDNWTSYRHPLSSFASVENIEWDVPTSMEEEWVRKNNYAIKISSITPKTKMNESTRGRNERMEKWKNVLNFLCLDAHMKKIQIFYGCSQLSKFFYSWRSCCCWWCNSLSSCTFRGWIDSMIRRCGRKVRKKRNWNNQKMLWNVVFLLSFHFIIIAFSARYVCNSIS